MSQKKYYTASIWLSWLNHPLRAQYEIEFRLSSPADATVAVVLPTVVSAIERSDVFVIEEANRIVAMSTFTARRADRVQIGGVFTAADKRSKGYARAVVAGSLKIVGTEGIRRATLFTGVTSYAAQRAYQAVGFQRVGDYGIVLFERAR